MPEPTSVAEQPTTQEEALQVLSEEFDALGYIFIAQRDTDGNIQGYFLRQISRQGVAPEHFDTYPEVLDRFEALTEQADALDELDSPPLDEGFPATAQGPGNRNVQGGTLYEGTGEATTEQPPAAPVGSVGAVAKGAVAPPTYAELRAAFLKLGYTLTENDPWLPLQKTTYELRDTGSNPLDPNALPPVLFASLH